MTPGVITHELLCYSGVTQDLSDTITLDNKNSSPSNGGLLLKDVTKKQHIFSIPSKIVF